MSRACILHDQNDAGARISSKLARARAFAPHTVWSVNDGLSGNLWKPPETGRGGFWQVPVFILLIKKNQKKYINKKFGNLPETSRKPPRLVSGGFQRFSDNPSLTDHTVHTKRGNPLPAFLLLLRQRLVNDHEFTTAMQSNCVVVAAALDATTRRRRRRRRRRRCRHQATAQDGCGARWRA